MTTGVRRGNDNEGPLVDVEPQEGVVDVPIPFEVVAGEVGEVLGGQEVDASQEAHDEGVESGALVGPRVERTGIRWRLGIGTTYGFQRDQQPRG